MTIHRFNILLVRIQFSKDVSNRVSYIYQPHAQSLAVYFIQFVSRPYQFVHRQFTRSPYVLRAEAQLAQDTLAQFQEIFGCVLSSVLKRSPNTASPLGCRHITHSCSTKGLSHGVVVRLGLAVCSGVQFSTALITNIADVVPAFPIIS